MSLGAEADSGTLKDPTRPEGLAEPVTGRSANVVLPTLNSVLIGDDRKLAVIDGRIMAEGDVSNGVLVRRISADRVVVTLNNSPQVTLLLDAVGIHKEAR